MTKNDYKAAMGWIDRQWRTDAARKGKTYQSIRHALLIADRLMQEPSGDMIKEMVVCTGQSFDEAVPKFKAMRDQMLKEIEG